jgi:hypothetical protein
LTRRCSKWRRGGGPREKQGAALGRRDAVVLGGTIQVSGGSSTDLQNEFVGAVIGAMASSEDLSTQILNNPELSQKLLGELVPIIYRGLKPTA